MSRRFVLGLSIGLAFALQGCRADVAVQAASPQVARQCLASGLAALGPGLTLVSSRWTRAFIPADSGLGPVASYTRMGKTVVRQAWAVMAAQEGRDVRAIVADSLVLEAADEELMKSAANPALDWEALRAVRPGVVRVATLTWPVQAGDWVMIPYSLDCGYLCDRSGILVLKFAPEDGCTRSKNVVLAES